MRVNKRSSRSMQVIEYPLKAKDSSVHSMVCRFPSPLRIIEAKVMAAAAEKKHRAFPPYRASCMQVVVLTIE